MNPDELFHQVYDQLRKLAQAKLAAEKPGHTLDATALVHEVWLKLSGRSQYASKVDYLLAAAQAMRRILVDHARARQSRKRCRDGQQIPLESLEVWQGSAEDWIDLDSVLDRFAEVEPHKARLVELHIFSGLTLPEVGELLGISLASAERWWRFSRLWLYAELSQKNLQNP